MNPATPQEKGNALEVAVAAIEDFILRTSPALREESYVIESKKIVVVGGVRHEIDVYVTIDLESGYKSIFIFECKNWKEAVGKNEIIVFTEKIEACGAQKGYFVAKSFTSDAEAQAQKDSRITLAIATEHDATMPAIFASFQFFAHSPIFTSIDVKFSVRGSSGCVSILSNSRMRGRFIKGKLLIYKSKSNHGRAKRATLTWRRP